MASNDCGFKEWVVVVDRSGRYRTVHAHDQHLAGDRRVLPDVMSFADANAEAANLNAAAEVLAS